MTAYDIVAVHYIFFFKQKTAYEMRISDWSSDVCSSDLDTYIEKESSINEQIDRMRHSATRALFERRDVVIVASASCIYGIGSPETYATMTVEVKAEIGRASCRERVCQYV